MAVTTAAAVRLARALDVFPIVRGWQRLVQFALADPGDRPLGPLLDEQRERNRQRLDLRPMDDQSISK